MDEELLHIVNNFENLGQEFVVGNRNKIKTFDYQGQTINIKSFRIPIFINGIIYKFFRKSKAKRSFENATILINKGIKTPRPIAYYEKFSGIFLKESYYICEHLQSDFIFRDVMGNEDKYDMEKILKGIAKLSFDLHQNGIEFLDHSPGNTLIKIDKDNNYNYFLVDLNRMKFHNEMSFKMRMNNLKKITPSKHMIRIIANEYAQLYKISAAKIYTYLWNLTAEFQKKSIRKQEFKKKLKFWNS